LIAAVFFAGAGLLLAQALGGCELLLDTSQLTEENGNDATTGDGSGSGSSSGGSGSSSGATGPDATTDSGDAMMGAEVGPIDAPPCDGPVYYVSAANGNDANPGCSPTAPKKTIAAGIAASKADSTSQPTIEVCAGTYAESNLTLDLAASLLGGFDCSTWAGDAGAAATTTITNASPATQSVTLLVFGSAVKLDGFTIQGGASVTTDGGTSGVSYAAVEISGPGAPIISNNVLTGGSGPGYAPASAGVVVDGNGATSTPLIVNNVISGGSGVSDGTSSVPASVGVYAANGGAPVIRGNTIDGGSGTGMLPASSCNGSAGVMTYATAGNLTLDGNTINGGSGQVASPTSTGAGSQALWIWGTSGATYTITDNVMLAGTGSVVSANTANSFAVRAVDIGSSAAVVFTGNTVDGGVVQSGGQCPQAVDISDPPTAPGSVIVSGNRIHGGHCTAFAPNLAGNTSQFGVRLSGPFTTLTVENNMIDSGQADVHRLAGAILLTNSVTGAVVRHNTLVALGSGYYAIGLWVQGQGPIANVVENNVLAATGPMALAMNVDNNGFCSPDAGVSAAFTSVRNNLVFGSLAGFMRFNCSNSVVTTLDAMDAALASVGTTVAGNLTIASSCAATDGGTLAGCITMPCAAGGGSCLNTVFAGWDDAGAGYGNLFSDAGFEGGCPAAVPPVVGGIGDGWFLATGAAGTPPCLVARSSLNDVADGGVAADLYGNCRGARPTMGAAEVPPDAACF
jgi:hypothetical protein